MAHLAHPGEFRALLAAARSRDWVVYAKGPEQDFRYLARYSHRIAISDSRIIAFDGETVSFRHRKPAMPDHKKPRYGTMTLCADEFIRRFLLHVLPERMHRIRHFGILAKGRRTTTLQCARKAMGTVACSIPDGTEGNHDNDTETATAPVACPHCGGLLRRVRDIPWRGTMNPLLSSHRGTADSIPARRSTRPRRSPTRASVSQPATAPTVRGPKQPPHRPTGRKPATTTSS